MKWSKRPAQASRRHGKKRRNKSPNSAPRQKKSVSVVGEPPPEFIVDVVFQSIKGALQSRIVRIYVNKKDLPHIEAAKERIRAPFEHLENLHFDTRADIEEGSAIIETEKGIINATLESQFRALERAFETFKKR